MKQEYYSRLQISSDEAAHSEHGILIRCGIGPKTVERSGIEYLNL
jgi:hypothetical protein